ncbi:MAG TPA: hypothetical protein VGI50_18950 [Solirubrobacteraceae bacterium]
MAQLVAKQVLIALHIRLEGERTERSAALCEHIPDAPSDQLTNQVVMKHPPRLVANRHGIRDEADRLIDQDPHVCERTAASVAGDYEGEFGACQSRPPAIPLAVPQPRPLPADLHDLSEGA